MSTLLTLAASSQARAALAVIPFPGTPDASPSSQIIFSTLRPSAIRSVTVRGTRTGLHSGRLTALPGGAGTSFAPARPFADGERVTVSAQLDSAAAGSASGAPGRTQLVFSFGVSRPLPGTAPVQTSADVGHGAIGGHAAPAAQAAAGGWQSYRSLPRVHPPLVAVSRDSRPGDGDIFLSPVRSGQMGPMILSPQGRLIWFKHTGRPTPFNFEVQGYLGHPVLTWWQGKVVDGHGADGRDMILNSSYHTVAVLHGGNGYSSDLHEFQLIPRGRALVDAYVPVSANLSSVGGPSSGTVLDCVIQELDVRTNRVLWEWHALGHIPLSASQAAPSGSSPFDFFHLNSIQQLAGGKLIISARNTWSVYMIDERTGRVQWTLGGRYSNYSMGPGTNFEWQHDARMHRRGILTVFDDGSYPPVEAQSSAKELRVNARTGRVTLIRQFTHLPGLLAGSQGNAQLLDNGNMMIGWGSASAFSEYSPRGHELVDGRFRLGVNSYRTYRFHWTGTPTTRPSLAVVPGADGSNHLYASWNGATDVASWEVLGGHHRHVLVPLTARSAHLFETAITVRDDNRFYAVEALDSRGHALGRSFIIATPRHLAVYGQRAFASISSGVAGIPVGCGSRRTCHVHVTLRAGGSRLGPSRAATIAARSAAIVPVRLSPAGRRRLRGARHHQLTVEVAAGARAGPGATRRLKLVGYSIHGRSPPRRKVASPTIQLLGTSEFIGARGGGGVLAVCYRAVPCHVQFTIYAGHEVIAHPTPVDLGADEAGYLPFRLTPSGRSMLRHARGNQLAAEVALADRGELAGGRVVLSRYG